MDPAAFNAAYDKAGIQVASDLGQGEQAGVEATPTIYFNDRKYEGPPLSKYLAMWIDEEMAVNR